MQHHLHCHNLDPPLYMLAEYESMRDPRAIARVTAVLMLTMIVMPLDHSERRSRPHLRAGASSGHPATLHQHEPAHNRDYCVLGVKLRIYDQVAKKLSAVLGLCIEHVKLSGDERYQGLVSAGVSDCSARFLTHLKMAASTGVEARMNDERRKRRASAQSTWISLYKRMSPPGWKSRAGRVGTCIRSLGAT